MKRKKRNGIVFAFTGIAKLQNTLTKLKKTIVNSSYFIARKKKNNRKGPFDTVIADKYISIGIPGDASISSFQSPWVYGKR